MRPGISELSPKESGALILPTKANGKAEVDEVCGQHFGYYVLGYVDGGIGQLYVSICSDGSRLADVARAAGKSDLVVALARNVKDPTTPRRYGTAYNERAMPSVTLFYFPAEIAGAPLPISTAMWVDKDSQRAIVLQLVAFGFCEPKDPYVSHAVCQDRSTALEKIATALAQDSRARP